MANEIIFTVGIMFSAFITILTIVNESWERDQKGI